MALGRDHQFQQRLDDVADVGEAALLRAVAEHRDRLALQRLAHEGRHHHAVLPGLARSHGVEEPHHDHRLLGLFPVGQRQELVERLAAGIGPAVPGRRAHHQVGVLAERDVNALAVDLRGGGDEHQLLLLRSMPEDDLGAVHVGLDRVHGLLDDQLDAHRGGEVKDHVGAIDHLGDQGVVEDGIDRVMKAGAALEMGDVVDRAGGEVVEHEHFMPVAQQGLGQVRADKTSATRNQDSHRGIVVAGSTRRFHTKVPHEVPPEGSARVPLGFLTRPYGRV